MPMPRLPATHHITRQRISAFQVKKKTAARAARCRATIIEVTPQFTDSENVLSCFNRENRLMVVIFTVTASAARSVGNRQPLVKKLRE
jgi:hypothetical protein